MIQELVEEHNVFEMLSWPPNPPELNPIKHLLEGLGKLVHADILVPDTTANVGQKKGIKKNIRQVLIIFWLMSV